MNFGSDARPLGRYIVDVDGSLRATDTACVSPADIIALHGAARLGSTLVWERNGETIALASHDRIELDEGTVFFFRTAPKRRLHRQGNGEFLHAFTYLGAGDQRLHAPA